MRKSERQRVRESVTLKRMPTRLFLSPHLDDAALSCGGLIHKHAQQADRIVVVTVCAGDAPASELSPFAESLHARWKTPNEVVAVRRAEDLAATQVLGAEAIHWDVPDCIYRTDPATGAHLYTSEESLFGEWHIAEWPLAQRLAQSIMELCRLLHAEALYAPLTIGHHVDHQLVRRAAELTRLPLVYYEDYPYAARESEIELWGGLAQGPDDDHALSPERVIFAEPDLEAKCQAIAAYASQISTFWAEESALWAAIRQFAERQRAGQLAERVWK